MKNIEDLKSKYGTVEFKGKEYILTDQAGFTGRVLPDPLQESHFEMSCTAIDKGSREYLVYWIFENMEEWELDQYNYDNVDRVVKQ